MYNRRTRELADMRRKLELAERGRKATRDEMIESAARKKRRDAALTASYHGRIETWLNSTATDVRDGIRPASPDYQTKKLMAHHRFRDRDMSKEIGPPRVSAYKQCKAVNALAEPLFSNERDRIGYTRAEFSRSLLLEAYKQPNELPAHTKYPLRTRKHEGDLGGPMRYGEQPESQRILASTERNAMLETHGSYDRAVHASKFNGPHEHRADKTMAPHWREYRPDKWISDKPFRATVGGGDFGLRQGDDLPHDFIDMKDLEKWLPYMGRIGSLARGRRQVNEIDQTRQFLPNVATGEFVTGPDHRKWATLPANFASSKEFSTEDRQFYKAAGHYAHAFMGGGNDGLPPLDSSFGKVPERMATAKEVLNSTGLV